MAKHFDQFPALQAGHGACFHDTDLIADLGEVLLVVRIELLAALNDFLEPGVGDSGDVNDHNGLFHLIGSHYPNAGLADTLRFILSIIAHL